MNLNKLLPLTETTFYVMLSLLEPAHGYVIMQKVEDLSEQKVRIAAGTLYGALENLTRQKLIKEVPNDDKRRRVYALTDNGKNLLRLEIQRLKHLVTISEHLISEEGNHYESI
jgi:DNA-binding PadR family transcriptional regulator